MDLDTLRLLAPRRRPYSIDEIQDLMFTSKHAGVPARGRRRARKLLSKLTEAERNQARIVAKHRFRQAWEEVKLLQGWD